MRSLFWKIFACFFLANLLVMGLTTYIAFEASHSELAQQHHYKLSTEIANNIIERYENSQQQPPPSLIGAKRLKRIQRRLEVHTADGQHIFGHIDPKNRTETLSYSLLSEHTQKRYDIVSKAPKIPKGLERMLRFTQSVRFVLILFTSLAVSFALSLLISRPLEQLGQHARNVAGGNLQSRVDQTLLKRNDEIGELSRELDSMAGQLDTIINSKQQLLHDVSHELRAPLARLQTASALLEQSDSEDPHAQRINKECQRMNALIQEILNYARLDATAQQHSFFDLATLLRELVKDVQYEQPQHPIHFLQLPEQADFTGNADRLSSAIENILRNACKHTPEQTAIDITLTQKGAHWHIRIRDHGPGVAEGELALLSKPFYRAHNSMHGDGFGLGLSIAQRAVRQHQGTMHISNHANGGLEVSILLAA